MKVRFFSIQDLYDEVKELADHLFVEKVVRMQFLEKTYNAEYKGAGKTFYQVMTEQILTLSVSSIEGIYYYSLPYFRCMKIELKDKADAITKMCAQMEKKVRLTFVDWTIKKGVYEESSF